jgi:hypothetical protein
MLIFFGTIVMYASIMGHTLNLSLTPNITALAQEKNMVFITRSYRHRHFQKIYILIIFIIMKRVMVQMDRYRLMFRN